MTKEYYDRALPLFGEVMSLKEFQRSYKKGDLKPNEGIAYPVKDGFYASQNPIVFKRMYLMPVDATDVLWIER